MTSLWRARARPRASKPGPRFAEVAGTRTWARTRLQPLEEPVRREGVRPGVQRYVPVHEDENADDDENDAGGALDHGDEGPVTLEERKERAEGRRRHQEGQPEPGRVGDQQAAPALNGLGGSGEREDGARKRPHARRPAAGARD